MMEYKGYVGRYELDPDANVFHGEVIDTRDVITFQSETAAGLQQAFRDSIDDYLAFCAERGESPDKPFRGEFLVRVSPDQHRKFSAAASAAGVSLNSWAAEQLDRAAAGGPVHPGRRRKGAKRSA
jgi:predicted HicB family RNase H-like nuclease